MFWGHCRACLSLQRNFVSDGWRCNFKSAVFSFRNYGSIGTHSRRSLSGAKTKTQLDNYQNICEVSQFRYIFNRHMGNAIPNESTILQSEKCVGITRDDQQQIVHLTPVQPKNPHVLKVSIIGAPNAGKSSLANKLIGWRIATVSKKVHTTRSNAIGVWSKDNTQVIFLDTPGLITPEKIKKHNLEKSLLTDPYSSLFEADLIIAVIDISKAWNRSSLDKDVLTALTLHGDKKSILVLNKVDLLKCKSDLLTTSRLLTEGVVGGQPSPHYNVSKTDKEIDILDKIMLKRKLMEETNDDEHNIDDKSQDDAPIFDKPVTSHDEQWWTNYFKKLKQTKMEIQSKRGWAKFESIFMICALDGDGIDDIKQYLIETSQPGPWQYHNSVVTDQDPIDMAKLCVREILLDHLPKEIPYRIEIKVTQWEYDENNSLSANIDLICQRKRDVVHVIGQNGDIINQIQLEVKQSMMNTFKQDLGLKLNVLKKYNN